MSIEKIEKEKIARKLEFLRNDFLVFICFGVLSFFVFSSQEVKDDWSTFTSWYFIIFFLFYLLFFSKTIICSFIFNQKNDTRFMFFSPLFLFQSGSFLGWISHFLKSSIWFWKKSKEDDLPIIRKMKMTSNILIFLVIILFMFLIYINSKEVF